MVLWGHVVWVHGHVTSWGHMARWQVLVTLQVSHDCGWFHMMSQVM